MNTKPYDMNAEWVTARDGTIRVHHMGIAHMRNTIRLFAERVPFGGFSTTRERAHALCAMAHRLEYMSQLKTETKQHLETLYSAFARQWGQDVVNKLGKGPEVPAFDITTALDALDADENKEKKDMKQLYTIIVLEDTEDENGKVIDTKALVNEDVLASNENIARKMALVQARDATVRDFGGDVEKEAVWEDGLRITVTKLTS